MVQNKPSPVLHLDLPADLLEQVQAYAHEHQISEEQAIIALLSLAISDSPAPSAKERLSLDSSSDDSLAPGAGSARKDVREDGH